MISNVGLMLDIIGAWLWLRGEMHGAATYLKKREASEGKDHLEDEIAKLSWPKRWPLAVSRMLGLRYSVNQEQDSLLNQFPMKFWAIVLITVGFLLQVFGRFCCQSP